MMKKLVIIALILFVSIGLVAQERAHGHLIVMHRGHIRGDARAAFMSRYSAMDMAEEEVLSPQHNIILYTFDYQNFDEDEMLEMVRQDNDVYLAQFNPYLTWRGPRDYEPHIPDDPSFNQQYHLRNTGQSGGVVGADVSATLAWAATLSIENKNERDIVIAIPDTYSQIAHTDVNWWRNTTGYCYVHEFDCPDETPHDYWGWNATSNAPLTQSPGGGTHGIGVSGIAGAMNDNNFGVASIAGYGAKVMAIYMSLSGGTLAADAVKAYNYILTHRTLYNETNGQYGAYVVATNASWGLDGAWPHQYPIWAEMIDLMGAQGVLATQAPPNANINIDTAGDMPGTIVSPWSITVTNTTNTDIKNTGAAYGPIHVHLGAPGTNIFTTTQNNNFGNAGTGTSFAAPQVASAIGLMYLAATEDLLSAFDHDPGELAIMFRQLLLEGVDPNASLATNTVTGGRLNIFNPILGVIELNEEYGVPKLRIPFTLFDFEGDTMLPSIGEGTLSTIGGVTSAFVLGWEGSGTGGRALNTTDYPAQGTASETAGITIAVSTVDYSGVHLSWNNLNSNTAANRTRLQYTLDGSTWLNFNAAPNNATNIRYIDNDVANAVDMGFDNGMFITQENHWYARSVNFTDIAGVNDNPNFAVRFVTAYPTGATEYGATGATSNYGSAGTMRYDNISFYQLFDNVPIAYPPSGIHISPLTVSLTTLDEGAIIYYTTNEEDPTAETGTVYTGPLSFTEDTVLKFVSIKGEEKPSKIITEIYYVPTIVNSLSELRDKTPGTGELFNVRSEVLVTFTQPNFRNQVFVQDNTAGILVDDADYMISPLYTIGDAVKDLVGRLVMVNQMLQFIPAVNTGMVTSSNNTIVPIVATIQELSDNPQYYEARLVKMNKMAFTSTGNFAPNLYYLITDQNILFNFRTNFTGADYIGTPIPTEQVNIIGLISARNSGIHIAARSLADFEEVNPFEPPRNLDAEVDKTTVTLSWMAPQQMASPPLSSIQSETGTTRSQSEIITTTRNRENTVFNLTGYRVYRDNVALNTSPITALTYQDPGVAWDREYVYSVRAVYEGGVSDPVETNVIVPALHPVRNLVAVHNGNNVLTWDAPLPQQFALLRGYNVLRDGRLLNDEPIQEETYTDTTFMNNSDTITFVYEVVAVYDMGESEPVETELTVDDYDNPIEVYVTELGGNFPNPFNPETTINYTLEIAGNVSLEIFNIRGQKIRQLVNDYREIGHHQVIWNGTDDYGNAVGSGMYFYRMTTEDYSAVKRMMMLK